MLGDHHARKTIESACQFQGMSDNLKGGAAILLGYIQQLKAVARSAIPWKRSLKSEFIQIKVLVRSRAEKA